MPKLMLLRRTCKQAAASVIAREDCASGLPDHLALKVHMLACKACPHFEQQVLTLRAAMEKRRNHADTDESGR